MIVYQSRKWSWAWSQILKGVRETQKGWAVPIWAKLNETLLVLLLGSDSLVPCAGREYSEPPVLGRLIIWSLVKDHLMWCRNVILWHCACKTCSPCWSPSLSDLSLRCAKQQYTKILADWFFSHCKLLPHDINYNCKTFSRLNVKEV